MIKKPLDNYMAGCRIVGNYNGKDVYREIVEFTVPSTAVQHITIPLTYAPTKALSIVGGVNGTSSFASFGYYVSTSEYCRTYAILGQALAIVQAAGLSGNGVYIIEYIKD